MAVELTIVNQWLLPLAFIILGLIASFLFNRAILPLLRKCCFLAKHESFEVVAATSSRYVTLWFILVSFYTAVLFSPLSPPLSNFLKEILFVLAAGSVTLFIAKDATELFELYNRRHEGILHTTSMFNNMIYVLAGIFGALFILQSLGISITLCSPETLDFIYPSLVHGKEEQNRKANSAKNQIHNPLQNQ
jgi:small-conductance mechanosensitive channel